MTPMSIADLRTLVISTVESVTPREAYADGDAFRHFKPAVPAQGRRPMPVNAGRPDAVAPATAPQRTRRFRVELGTPTRVDAPLWGFGGCEHSIPLQLLVDYAARAADDARREYVARDDMMLIRDRLCAASGPSNGLQLVDEVSADDLGPNEDPDVRTFALNFNVRYFARQSPGA